MALEPSRDARRRRRPRAVDRLVIPGTVRGLLRLALLGLGPRAGSLDRVLRRADGDAPPAPIPSLIVIDAPIERVWAELADIEGQPRWMVEMKSVRLLTPPPDPGRDPW